MNVLLLHALNENDIDTMRNEMRRPKPKSTYIHAW